VLVLLLLSVIQLAATASTPKAAPRRYASLQDASELYAVPVKTLRDWIRRGRLPATRIGPRLLRVDLDDLDKLCRPVPAPSPRAERAESA
jgi:excisionase family DNA binding protein